MKRILLALALCLISSPVWSQCNGVFGANQVCGTVTGGIPGPVNAGSLPIGGLVPGTTGISPKTNGGVLWDNNGILGDSTTLPTGLTIPSNLTIGDGRLNLQSDYGAKCDGSTDDSTAIQNWLNANTTYVGRKMLYAPAGTCVHATAISYNADYPLHIAGAGKWQTQFKYTNATAGTGWTLQGSGTGAGSQNDTTLEQFGFATPTNTASPSINLAIIGRYNTEIKSLAFGYITNSAYTALSFSQSVALRIYDTLINHAGCNAIYTPDGGGDATPNNLVMIGNVIKGSGFTGNCYQVVFQNGAGLFVGGNDVEGGYGNWYFCGVNGLNLTANYSETPGANGNLTFCSGTRSVAVEIHNNYWASNGTIGNSIGNVDGLSWHDDVIATGGGAWPVTWATSTNAPTSVQLGHNSGQSNIASLASMGSCTGLGSTGTCSVSGNTTDGVVTLSPSGSGISSSGNAPVNFAAGAANVYTCVFNLGNGTAGWVSGATVFDGNNANASSTASWYNPSTNLTSGQTYQISYHCNSGS